MLRAAINLSDKNIYKWFYRNIVIDFYLTCEEIFIDRMCIWIISQVYFKLENIFNLQGTSFKKKMIWMKQHVERTTILRTFLKTV